MSRITTVQNLSSSGHSMSKARKRKKEDDVTGVAEKDNTLLSVTILQIHFKEECILNSNCPYHASPKREWFATYDSVRGGTVLMDNSTSRKVVGKVRIGSDLVAMWGFKDITRSSTHQN